MLAIVVNSSAKRYAFKFDASIVYPPIRPPSNKTFEPVICPFDFKINSSFEEFICVDKISNPPIVPALAVIVPCIVTSPFGDKWKFDELISMLPFEPLIYCDCFVPTKNLSTSIRALEPLTNNSLDMLSQTNCASDEPLPK